MIRAILFDKDGTLTDFRRTWTAAIGRHVHAIVAGTDVPPEAVADALGYDLAAGRIRDDAPVVTNALSQNAALVEAATGIPGARVHRAMLAERVEQVLAFDVPALFSALRARGLRLGILTNAGTAGARHHLAEMGALDLVDAVIGADLHGPKPAPDGALAFSAALCLAPREVLVVGDGMADLDAARAAGMPAVAVLTGTRTRAALAPHALAVLERADELPAWLDGRAA